MFIWMPPREAQDRRVASDKEPEKPQIAPTKTVPDFAGLAHCGPHRAIREFAGQPLRWVPLRARPLMRVFELRRGQAVLALVGYEPPMCGPHRGLGKTTEGNWSFQSHWRRVAIASSKGEHTLASPGRKGPTLSLPNGHNYFWRSSGFWRVEHHWLANDGALLISVKATSAQAMAEGEVVVEPSAVALPELDLLLTLGWFLRLCAMNPVTTGG